MYAKMFVSLLGKAEGGEEVIAYSRAEDGVLS